MNSQLLLVENLPDHIPNDLIPQLEHCLELIEENRLPVGIVWLFGSYSRGDYIRRSGLDENGQLSSYRSDIDLLIIQKEGDKRINGHQNKVEDLRYALAKHPGIYEHIHLIEVFSVTLNRLLQKYWIWIYRCMHLT